MKVIIFVIFLTISKCIFANQIIVESNWNQFCYNSFYWDATFLSGVSAVDCGLISENSTKEQRSQMVTCSLNAKKSKIAFKFAVVWSGIDSIVCEAGLRDTFGRYWLITFD